MSEKHKILAVDDTPSNLKMLIEALRGLDYEVLVATHGEKALELAQLHKPALILLDIMMPEIDGYEVCRRLKKDTELASIPVIFITAMTDEEDEAKGLELGAVDYISKPIRASIVQARVKTHMRLKLAYEELAEKNQVLEEMAQLREDVERITRHDLKTPLNSVIGYSSILLLDPLEEDQRDMVNNIKQSGYQMLEMINRSLDLYKMETGTYQYNPIEVNVLAILAKLETETSSLARRRQSQLKVEYDKNTAFIVIAEDLLCYSMLANLVKNAFEATPPQQTVTVSLRIVQTGLASIDIHNQGAVPDSIRDSFFEKYVTAGKNDGTGLGTYSAKLIADILGGDICMESSLEKGTRITVTLPTEFPA